MEKLAPTATERRRLTRNAIYQYLYNAPAPCTKQDIAAGLKLSMPTVHQNLSELRLAELVRPAEVRDSTGGRRALCLTIAENARFAVGVSVSSQYLRFLAANLRLEEIAYQKLPRAGAADLGELGGQIARELERFLDRFGLNRKKLLGVGIALPGIVSSDQKTLQIAPTLHLGGAALSELTICIPYPTWVANDATSGGYAEWYAQKDQGSIVFLSLEEGVGGAVLIDGAPYTGLNGRSGEFGHLCVQPGGLTCKCGRRGCLEAYCSAARISSDLGVTVEQFFAGVQAGNRAYQTLWENYLQYLAVALGQIRMAFDCNIVLGGYLAQYLAPWLPRIRELAAQHDPFDSDASYVQLCRYPRHAVPLGVSLHYIYHFIETL